MTCGDDALRRIVAHSNGVPGAVDRLMADALRLARLSRIARLTATVIDMIADDDRPARRGAAACPGRRRLRSMPGHLMPGLSCRITSTGSPFPRRRRRPPGFRRHVQPAAGAERCISAAIGRNGLDRCRRSWPIFRENPASVRCRTTGGTMVEDDRDDGLNGQGRRQGIAARRPARLARSCRGQAASRWRWRRPASSPFSLTSIRRLSHPERTIRAPLPVRRSGTPSCIRPALPTDPVRSPGTDAHRTAPSPSSVTDNTRECRSPLSSSLIISPPMIDAEAKPRP